MSRDIYKSKKIKNLKKQNNLDYFNSLSFKELVYCASLHGITFGENCKKDALIDLLNTGGVEVFETRNNRVY